MSINRWIDKEDVVYMYSGILLSHKQEWKWVIWSDVDGPRVCHTEWSKSEKITYINACVWDLGKWYRWPYLQGRKKGRCREQTCGPRGGWEGEGGLGGKIDMYTRACVKQMAGENCCIAQAAQHGALWCPGGAGWVEERLRREGAAVCMQLVHIVVQQRLAQPCKAVVHQESCLDTCDRLVNADR